jgi:hypothetical protein
MYYYSLQIKMGFKTKKNLPDLYKSFRKPSTILTLKLETATLAETLENLKYSLRHMPESRSHILNSRIEKLAHNTVYMQ